MIARSLFYISYSFINTNNRAYILEFFQILTNYLYILNIVHTEPDSTIKNSIMSLNENTLHIYIKFLGNNISYLIYHTNSINTLYIY